mmetsp:Transcript_117728/g.375256  ORF Transcript_117728/g.375256 Transcript_117728/m.375256 type:complete len:234 (+) Transcript_117728:926-1627(+)
MFCWRRCGPRWPPCGGSWRRRSCECRTRPKMLKQEGPLRRLPRKLGRRPRPRCVHRSRRRAPRSGRLIVSVPRPRRRWCGPRPRSETSARCSRSSSAPRLLWPWLRTRLDVPARRRRSPSASSGRFGRTAPAQERPRPWPRPRTTRRWPNSSRTSRRSDRRWPQPAPPCAGPRAACETRSWPLHTCGTFWSTTATPESPWCPRGTMWARPSRLSLRQADLPRAQTCMRPQWTA